MVDKATDTLVDFLLMHRHDVFSRFKSLKGAVTHGKSAADPDYVYIPGSRPPEERVLLVAHADTVASWQPVIQELVYFTESAVLQLHPDATPDALGADDRAGCAMLWRFRNSGHSLLITNDEETGCVGAYVASRTMREELGQHAFAVEVDRRGSKQMVFYDVSTRRFRRYMRQRLPGFYQQAGSFTDISVLCGVAQICGVNLSAGYHNEHSKVESLNVRSWLRTYRALKRLLYSRKVQRFTLPPGRGGEPWWMRDTYSPQSWGEYTGEVLSPNEVQEVFGEELYLFEAELYCEEHLPLDAAPSRVNRISGPSYYCKVCSYIQSMRAEGVDSNVWD